MEQLQQLEQQLLLTKAKAFDLQEQLGQQGGYIQMCNEALGHISQKLQVPVGPHGQIEINQIMVVLDALLSRSAIEPENTPVSIPKVRVRRRGGVVNE